MTFLISFNCSGTISTLTAQNVDVLFAVSWLGENKLEKDILKLTMISWGEYDKI